MAERKVLIKYIPKNFDPERLVKRGRGKDRLMWVRNMLPMSIRCNTCSNYLYIGTKFNMRMEICNEQMYLGIKVFRFYLKCTSCYADITFKTDPKNHDYVVETGGTRNYDPNRDALQAQRLLKKMKLSQQQGNSMKFLENKTYDSKREMELLQVLDDIKNENKRQATLNPEQLLKQLFQDQLKKQMFTEEEEQQYDKEYETKRMALLEESWKIQQEQQNLQKKRNAELLKDEKLTNGGFKKPKIKSIKKVTATVTTVNQPQPQ